MGRSDIAPRGSGRSVGLHGAGRFLRDVVPISAVIAGFAAVALLIDFCVRAVWQAMH